MEIRQLRYFLAICEELHFTRAAVKLNITQPTLSHQIKALEDQVGTLLFDRIGRKIELTEAGEIVREQAQKIFNNIECTFEKIDELDKIKRGNIKVGAMPGELMQLASIIISQFHQKFPQIKIQIIGLDDIIERVTQNKIDLALTILPIEDDRFERIHLYYEEFYLVVPNNHVLSHAIEIDFETISRFPMVLFPKNHNCRTLVDDAANSLGLQIQPIIETTTVDSILTLVKEGAGVTILSKTLINMRKEEGLKMIKIKKPALCRSVGIVYSKDKYIGKAAKEFIHILEESILNLSLN